MRLVERHGPDGYRRYLEELRWPGGAECPRCESIDLLWLERRAKYQCRGCRYHFRVTAGTVFHDSHLPIRKWLVAVALMISSEEGISARRLAQILGGSYKTSWFLEHRIRAAMAATRQEPELSAHYAAPAGVLPERDGGGAEAEQGGHAAPSGWRFLRKLIAGAHGNLGAKYLPAYWGEAHWRDANRANPSAFRDTVTALLGHPMLTYGQLVTNGAGGAQGSG